MFFLPAVPSEPGPPSTRQGQREGSYHPMATDSDSDGGVSDGDPPDYSGGPRPALIAPRPSLGSASVGGSGGGSGGGSSSKKRSFDELEDIVFSNPKSFIALCKEIAASRNMTILIGDDRTHKVSSAYMHVLCSYRKAGCPFIVKLTKAKEGGWLIRGGEVDTKQRSTYRCRHPAGSKPDLKVGLSIDEWIRTVDARSASHPNGGRPKAAKPRPVVPQLDAPAQEESSAGRAPRMSSRTATRSSLAAPAPAPSSSTSGRPIGAPVTYAAIEPERALAPPFQRAIDLQAQIVPALSPRQAAHHPQHQQPVHYPNGYSPRTYPSGGDPYRGLVPSPSQPGPPPPHARAQPHHPQPHPHHHPHAVSHHHQAPPPSAPRPAPVDPAVLAEWTAVLTLIGDADLVPLARVLASPYVSCTPASFFAEARAARLKLVDALPNESTGLWPKIKLGQRLAGDEGDRAWARLRGGEPGSRSESPARSAEVSRSVSVSASDASAAQVHARVVAGGPSLSATAAKLEPGVGEGVLPPRQQQPSQTPSGMFAAPARSSPPTGMDLDTAVGTGSPGVGARTSASQALSPASAAHGAARGGLSVASPPPRHVHDAATPV